MNVNFRKEFNFNALVYRRGFLLTKCDEKVISEKGISEELHFYKKTFFGPYKLWFDERLSYATVRTNKIGVGILGLAINPFDFLYNNQDISEVLFDKLLISENDFFDYVDKLTGAFLIFYRINDKVRLLQDACATKPVYYHTNGENLTVASHINIVAKIHALPKKPAAIEILKNDSYKADPSPYLPGIVTAYKGVYPLTANNLLDCHTCKSIRFFPRELLPTTEFNESLVHELAEIFQTQARLLADSRDIAIAITAGKDSRLTLSAFQELSSRSFCFTFFNKETGQFQKDVEIGKQLTSKKGFNHNSYDLSNYHSKSFNQVFFKNSPHGIWPKAANLYAAEFKENLVHVRSTVSEVGRCFYAKGREGESFDASMLAEKYTITEVGRRSEMKNIFEEYISRTNFDQSCFFNYHYLDLFYWEHRNSKWQGILCQEAEMGSDVFIPYNNREILKGFLSVPVMDRLSARLHLALIDYMEPRFASIPLDSNV